MLVEVPKGVALRHSAGVRSQPRQFGNRRAVPGDDDLLASRGALNEAREMRLRRVDIDRHRHGERLVH